ncbi:solute carrier family 2, facilitated glucose transporter member 2 [Mucor ambiguus]|uniref:Solute carrier family 2, facilitated glucose transporter member 2 n=1 Tax=Mucor ambiguus TaxID=91626 RepID=A0A0C9MU69_9FUNG|nr:solute carrier family 2, facilitated glucose transporter member 2 [Mucor ambiguus]
MSVEPSTSSLDLTYPKYMVFCVVVASLNFFCIGWVTGSANLPGTITHACENGIAHVQTSMLPDCLPMSDALWGFAVASFCVGALIGGLLGGYIQTKLGRRRTIFYNSFGYTIGGILISCSTSPSMFIVSRIICGLSCGVGSLTVPIYVGEISTVKSRGVMGTVNQMMTSTGILLSCIVGLPLSTVPLWRINYAIVTVPAVMQIILMPFCIESPRYLVSINKLSEAKASLQRLRPNTSIDMEFYAMVEGQLGSNAAMAAISHSALLTAGTVEPDYFMIDSSNTKTDNGKSKAELIFNTNKRQLIDAPLSTPPLPTPPPIYSKGSNSNPGIKETKTPMNMIQIFCDPSTRRVALIVILIHCFQQLIGINAVMYYSTTMFTKVFNPYMSKYMAIVCSAVNFLLTVVSIVLVDRTGRRSLLLVSQAGACIFAVLLTVGYVYSINALLVLSIFSYVALFAVGMGPVPWILISELSPVYASSSVGSAAAAMNWAMNFLIGQCFPIIFSSIQGHSFLIFAVVAFTALLFTYFKIPETKGRSIEDITAGLQSASD